VGWEASQAGENGSFCLMQACAAKYPEIPFHPIAAGFFGFMTLDLK